MRIALQGNTCNCNSPQQHLAAGAGTRRSRGDNADAEGWSGALMQPLHGSGHMCARKRIHWAQAVKSAYKQLGIPSAHCDSRCRSPMA